MSSSTSRGIAAIVDAIGGVDYDVPFRMQYSDPSQHLEIDLQPGMQHLTGKQTVEFLRWRHNNDYSKQYVNGDEGRVENQQKFLKELARQVLQVKKCVQNPEDRRGGIQERKDRFHDRRAALDGQAGASDRQRQP